MKFFLDTTMKLLTLLMALSRYSLLFENEASGICLW